MRSTERERTRANKEEFCPEQCAIIVYLTSWILAIVRYISVTCFDLVRQYIDEGPVQTDVVAY